MCVLSKRNISSCLGCCRLAVACHGSRSRLEACGLPSQTSTSFSAAKVFIDLMGSALCCRLVFRVFKILIHVVDLSKTQIRRY